LKVPSFDMLPSSHDPIRQHANLLATNSTHPCTSISCSPSLLEAVTAPMPSRRVTRSWGSSNKPPHFPPSRVRAAPRVASTPYTCIIYTKDRRRHASRAAPGCAIRATGPWVCISSLWRVSLTEGQAQTRFQILYVHASDPGAGPTWADTTPAVPPFTDQTTCRLASLPIPW
jgi:hypothetical protein